MVAPLSSLLIFCLFFLVAIIKIEQYFIEIKTYFISERNEDEMRNKVKIFVFS